MRKYFIIALLAVLALGAGGCQNYGFIKADQFDKKIDSVKVELSHKLDENNKKLLDNKDATIQQQESMGKQASGLLYGAIDANYMTLNPTRIDLIERNRMEAAVALLPTPDAKELIKQKKELQEELNEQKMSNAQLQEKYNQEKLAAAEKQRLLEEQKKEAQRIKDEKEKLVTDANRTIEDLRNKQHESDQAKLATEAQKRKDAEKREANIRLLIYIFSGLGVAAGIAAYFLRSLEIAGVAAIALGLAILIAALEPWQLVLAALAMVGLVWLGLYRKYRREKDTKERVIGAVQEHKVSNPQAFANGLKDKLADWFKDDPKGEKHVDKTLQELNLK